MPTQTRPRQLNKAAFIARCRELIDGGASHDEIVARMDPVRSMSVTVEYMLSAIGSIAEALAVAESVSNPKMTQAHRNFVNYERRAQEEAHVYSCRCAHIEKAYPDEPIRRAKRIELDAGKDKYRVMADQASEAWTQLQKQRIPLDDAARLYPAAFPDHVVWQPKPV